MGQVAASLAYILRQSQTERRAMGARGRDLALSRHTPETVGERYRTLLRKAAGR